MIDFTEIINSVQAGDTDAAKTMFSQALEQELASMMQTQQEPQNAPVSPDQSLDDPTPPAQ